MEPRIGADLATYPQKGTCPATGTDVDAIRRLPWLRNRQHWTGGRGPGPGAPQHFKIYLSGGTGDTGGGMCAWSLAGAGAGCDNRPGAAAPGRDRAVLETQDRGCTKGARIHPRPSRDTHSWATGQGHRSVSRSAEGAAPGTQGRGCRPRAEGRWPVTCECLQRTARLPYPGPPRT